MGNVQTLCIPLYTNWNVRIVRIWGTRCFEFGPQFLFYTETLMNMLHYLANDAKHPNVVFCRCCLPHLLIRFSMLPWLEEAELVCFVLQSFEQTFHLLPVAKKMAENCPQSTTKMTPQCHFLQTLSWASSAAKQKEKGKSRRPQNY